MNLKGLKVLRFKGLKVLRFGGWKILCLDSRGGSSEYRGGGCDSRGEGRASLGLNHGASSHAAIAVAGGGAQGSLSWAYRKNPSGRDALTEKWCKGTAF